MPPPPPQSGSSGHTCTVNNPGMTKTELVTPAMMKTGMSPGGQHPGTWGWPAAMTPTRILAYRILPN